MPYKDPDKQKQWQREHYLRNKDKFYERTRNFRLKNQEYVTKYLSEHPCVDCGESNPLCLDFHHLENKIMSISNLIQGNKLEKIIEEIKKCDVVCKNCHAIRTATDRNFLRLSLVA